MEYSIGPSYVQTVLCWTFTGTSEEALEKGLLIVPGNDRSIEPLSSVQGNLFCGGMRSHFELSGGSDDSRMGQTAKKIELR